jgi:uncharacterized membrane protein
MKKTRYLYLLICVVAALIICALIISAWMPVKQSLRLVFGSVYCLFIPGFVWSWVFWKKDDIDITARIVLSVVLSMALVPLIGFLLNKAGVLITLPNIILEILGIILVGIIIFSIILRYQKKYVLHS